MKMGVKKLKQFMSDNKFIVIGFVLVTVFLFSNYFLGYQLSFTNVNYSFAPFNSTETAVQGPLLSDIADSHYPTVFRIFYSGEGFSLWDSDIALGREIDTMEFLMNPMEWVYVLPMGIAVFLKAFSEFAIGFFAMYLFMGSIGVKKYSAALAGVIYTFSSVIVVWLGWPHSDVAVWAPLLFFAVQKLIDTLQVKYILLTAFVIFMMLIVGMPTYAAYFMYLAGVYIVIFAAKEHWHHKKNIFIIYGMFAIGVIIAVCASLPYTYNLLLKTVFNGYAASRTDQGVFALGLEYLRTFIMPYERTGLAVHINEATLYIGVPAVLSLPFAVIRNKEKKRNLFFIISSLVLSVWIFTDWLDFIFVKIPVANSSIKIRIITLLMFTLASLSGISLNDLFENTEYYKKRWWSFLLPLALFCVIIMYMRDLLTYDIVIVASLTLIAFVLSLSAKKLHTFAMVMLALVVMFDGSSFAAQYLPWIDASAPIIPEATDSVEYMMENTKQQERIVGVGKWVFFPNTPSYYDLDDIRIHGFEATNDDFSTYYTGIDDEMFNTKTRTSVHNIDNYNLLKYLGVKYLYYGPGDVGAAVGSNAENSKVFGKIESNSTLSQKIHLDGNFKVLKLFTATYDFVPQSTGNLTLSISDINTGKAVFTSTVPVKSIKNNAYLSFLNEGSDIEAGDYILSLSFGDLGNDIITVWMKEEKGNKVSDGVKTIDGAMSLYAIYGDDETEIAYIGQDQVIVEKLDEYADKAELAESVQVYDTQEEVLNAMEASYIDNAAFIAREDAKGEASAYDMPLSANEGVEVAEYTDSYVKLVCNSEHERYVLLNDYYYDGWKAYVNGEETEIERVNYLTRGVKIDKGEGTVVEFKYEPTVYYVIIGFSFGVIAATALVYLIFNKKLQNALQRLTAGKTGTENYESNK